MRLLSHPPRLFCLPFLQAYILRIFIRASLRPRKPAIHQPKAPHAPQPQSKNLVYPQPALRPAQRISEIKNMRPLRSRVVSKNETKFASHADLDIGPEVVGIQCDRVFIGVADREIVSEATGWARPEITERVASGCYSLWGAVIGCESEEYGMEGEEGPALIQVVVVCFDEARDLLEEKAILREIAEPEF